MKAYFFLLILGIAAYSVLYVYTFHVSPGIKEKSIEAWIEKELSRKPSYMESAICKECHLKIYNTWNAGNHSKVECETCHGAGYEHTKFRNSASIVLDNSRDSCMVCHKRITAREITVVSEDHGSGVKCTYCHDPHR
ncbi:MAG: multiheme c-type cytochrome [Archaeoglobaceae archaeon]